MLLFIKPLTKLPFYHFFEICLDVEFTRLKYIYEVLQANSFF